MGGGPLQRSRDPTSGERKTLWTLHWCLEGTVADIYTYAYICRSFSSGGGWSWRVSNGPSPLGEDFGRGRRADEENARKQESPKPSQVSSCRYESTGFTVPRSLQRVSNIVPESSRNGGLRLSKRSPQTVSTKCSQNHRFVVALWISKVSNSH